MTIAPRHYALWFNRHCQATPSAMAVAVSGGADSVALLLSLHDYTREQGITLTALTVDHGLRPESRAEAEWVAALCAEHGIAHAILPWEKDSTPASGLQAKAREARLSLMAGYCRSHGIRHLVLAHHLNDLAETVTMRLARGAGVEGLAGIPPVSPFDGVELLHPLLSFPKADLEAFLTARKQGWCEDKSNENPAYARNRIRKALKDAQIAPEPLATTARNMARVSDFVQQETQKAAAAGVVFDALGFISLHRPLYHSLHPEIQLRLLRHVFTVMNGNDKPRMDELEHLHRHLDHKHTLAKTVILCKGDKVFFCREPRHLPAPMPFGEGMWDKTRFMIHGKAEGFRLAPLGKAGVAFLRKQAQPLPAVPLAEVLYGLPALWHLENLVSVPHIIWEDAAFTVPEWGSIAFPKAELDPSQALHYT